MYGRAINVALEFPYLVNCLCCYVCQPCRRKEVRGKRLGKTVALTLYHELNVTSHLDEFDWLYLKCLLGRTDPNEVQHQWQLLW